MLSAGERKLAKMARPRSLSTFCEEWPCNRGGLAEHCACACGAHAHPEHCACTSRGPRAVSAYLAQGAYRGARPGRRALCLCVTLGHGRARCVRRERRELGRLLRRPGENVAMAAVPDGREWACLQVPRSWALPASPLAPRRPWVHCAQCEQRCNRHSQQGEEQYSYIPEVNVNTVSQLYFSTQTF